MPTISQLSTDQLRQALQLREQIEALQQRLDAMLNGTAVAAKAAPVKKGSRRFSPETLAKMKASQQARWAKIKGTNKPAAKTAAAAAAKTATPAKTSTGKKKRNLTPEGRAKLAASMKARWAARKQSAK